jgi:hypothetical protein
MNIGPLVQVVFVRQTLLMVANISGFVRRLQPHTGELLLFY